MSEHRCCANVWNDNNNPCLNKAKYTYRDKHWCGIHVPPNVKKDYPTEKQRIEILEYLLTRAYNWMQPMPCSASCESEHLPGADCTCDRESICDDIDASGFMGGARTIQIKDEEKADG